MDSIVLRKKFLEFFETRGHAAVSSSSLIPDDPSVLLTTAGMQQFKKYFTGELDFSKAYPGKIGAVSIQKSFRTSDIDEVGDERHLTFFEMMGNFSFGGYFKKEAITFAYEFITKEMGLEISYVTIFGGFEEAPKDEESKKVWQSLGIQDIREEGIEDVFWGPTGSSGPCGPSTEIYCKNAAGDDIEVWNLVFNQYMYHGSREELLSGVSGKKLEPLRTPGVDTGMGLERLAMIVQKKKNIFETDLFASIRAACPEGLDERKKRIVADHVRASAFLIGDGVRPSNKGAGYVLRRLLRRAIVYGGELKNIFEKTIDEYYNFYPELREKRQDILSVYEEERIKFNRTLKSGLKELERMPAIDAAAAFMLYESYGLPYEIIKEAGGARAASLSRAAFEDAFKKHQEISRAGQEKKFGGHGMLLDTGELKAVDERELKVVTRLHTATHLLNAALRKVLGGGIEQQGSDITVERTRFDFTFQRKLTAEEIQKIEDWVNDAIRRDLPVSKVEMPYEEAIRAGAIRVSREKYPERVNVYTIADTETGEIISRELCGGPHVRRTGEIGKFKIVKEESSSAGIRRIRAVVE